MKPQQTVNIQIPAIQLAMWGLKADLHISRHKAKLQKYPFDAGLDLFPMAVAYDTQEQSDSHVIITVPTGVHIFIPPGVVGMIKDRSSCPSKLMGATVCGGIIDATYTGELKCMFTAPRANLGLILARIEEYAKDQKAIGQILFLQCFSVVPTYSKPNTFGQPGVRGEGGWGSSDPTILPIDGSSGSGSN